MRGTPIAVLVSLVACHAAAPATPDAGPAGPHPLYFSDTSAHGNPFPDDRMVVDGELQVRDHYWEDYLPASSLSRTMSAFEAGNAPSFATIAGHGNSGFTLVRTSDALNPDSIAGNVLYAERVDGGWERGPDAVASFVDADGGITFIATRAAIPLADGTPAALVLTSGLKTTAGVSLSRAPDFDAEAQQDPSLAPIASALGLDPAQIVLKLDLKVQDSTADLLHIASWAAQDAPVAYAIHTADGGNDPLAPLGVWTGTDVGLWSEYLENPDAKRISPGLGYADVGAVVLGTFESHDLRDIRYDATGNLASAAWKPEWVRNPDAAPTVPLHFVLTLPTPDKKVNGKYRVVIVAHGLESRNTFDTSSARQSQTLVGALAERFAENGLACIGIDALDHGTRGFYTQLFDLNDLRTARENFRQTVADMVQLSRLVGEIDVDGDGMPDLDASSVGFFGNSLGSILGSVFMAADTRVKYGVLNVPTGGLGMMFLTAEQAPTLHTFVGLLIQTSTAMDYFNQPAFDQSLLLLSTEGQMVFESADPFDYGYLIPNKHVLAQESVGDKTLPNVNTDELFAAMRLTEATETRDDAGGVSGFIRVTPSDYGITDPNFDPHSAFFFIPQEQQQAIDFLLSQGTHLAPIHP